MTTTQIAPATCNDWTCARCNNTFRTISADQPHNTNGTTAPENGLPCAAPAAPADANAQRAKTTHSIYGRSANL